MGEGGGLSSEVGAGVGTGRPRQAVQWQVGGLRIVPGGCTGRTGPGLEALTPSCRSFVGAPLPRVKRRIRLLDAPLYTLYTNDSGQQEALPWPASFP